MGTPPSVRQCGACCGRDGRTPKNFTQPANNFNYCSRGAAPPLPSPLLHPMEERECLVAAPPSCAVSQSCTLPRVGRSQRVESIRRPAEYNSQPSRLRVERRPRPVRTFGDETSAEFAGEDAYTCLRAALNTYQFFYTADCPSPLRFDATAPKPEAEKSALQPSVRSGLNTHKFRAPTG